MIQIPTDPHERKVFLAGLGGQLTIEDYAAIPEFVDRSFNVIWSFVPEGTCGLIICFKFNDEEHNRMVTITDNTKQQIRSGGGVLIAAPTHLYKFTAGAKIGHA